MNLELERNEMLTKQALLKLSSLTNFGHIEIKNEYTGFQPDYFYSGGKGWNIKFILHGENVIFEDRSGMLSYAICHIWEKVDDWIKENQQDFCDEFLLEKFWYDRKKVRIL